MIQQRAVRGRKNTGDPLILKNDLSVRNETQKAYMSPPNDVKEQIVNYQSEVNAQSTGEFERDTFQPKSKFAQIKPPQEYTI